MQISCQRGKAFARYRGNPGRLDIQNPLECRFSVNAAPGRTRHWDEAGKALPGACPPPDKGRPLKKGPVFYALECGIFEQPSELFDSLVGFSILRGLFC